MIGRSGLVESNPGNSRARPASTLDQTLAFGRA